jgi:NAD(P)-dependent dehydrogenase (short-subunit alcohol dehydrogenase family)
MEGRVALVTGASSGIGRATAALFLKHGMRVGALGRTPDEVHREVGEMKRHGDVVPLIADISHPAEMERAVNELVERWGRLDVVFANAGINGVWAPIDELQVEEWNKTIAVNLTGTFYTVKFSVPHMMERGGSIIITSSVNGTRMFSNSGASAYATSKAGQLAFGKMMALELAQYKIRVNVICPGAIETEIDENTETRDLQHTGWPAEYPEGKVPITGGGPGKPEDVAQLALFLASDESRLITGTPIWIDGAESLIQG